MTSNNPSMNNTGASILFERVVSIIEEGRKNTVRAINFNIVLSYCLIGREIVEEIQEGKVRAEYGKQVLEELSQKLNLQYGKGFSVANLRLFRQFYLTYSKRIINHPRPNTYIEREKSPSDDLATQQIIDTIRYPMGSELNTGFNPQLSWSHYRALIRVKKDDARLFYEQEAAECSWDKRTLERHIRTQYYERMLKSQQPKDMLRSGHEITTTTTSRAIDSLKDPYVLEFLDLPDVPILHESELEAAIITQLQAFLMELGKGFAFVCRQKRMRFDDTDLYVDLVFYNCILKCYLLIDLKMGELTHRDAGQMDGYVRMFDDLYIAKDDNPTIGLILCTDKNDAVAKYSVISERKQIFASKYMLYLPTEEELTKELLRERRMIEERLEEDGGLVGKV
ncbi:MAG: PDDEXK nuclease domain-containing protein [Euryarchaeota archaeon]|nr:PDDEXK nuclease domain-containing protein [Euryarchaeota archaeon]